MSNILKMKLDIDVVDKDENNDKEYILTLTNIDSDEELYKFSLSDETTDNLKKFIDHLLKNINDYDKLEITFEDDNPESLKYIIGSNFKKIWEKEFDDVKTRINSL